MLLFSLSAAALLLQAVPIYVSALAVPDVSAQATNLTVDLGYSVYQGIVDTGTGLNLWAGVRYAAPPLGHYRFRAPQPPATNRSAVIPAFVPPACPQVPAAPGAPGFNYQGNEDCLFLNVYAPDNAKNLPVLFYIHGGGYGGGSGTTNVTQISQAAKLGFVSVVIQYRLGAFGFLSSSFVKNNGDLNAGLLDQHFALQWAQEHVAKFGGNPRAITIAGESAGGGSVTMQALAYGGTQGTQFFQQSIAASPYLPVTYSYNDPVVNARFESFVSHAGCGSSSTPMVCLRGVDTNTLQAANYLASTSINFGSWAYVPVVDGKFLQQRPSVQLQAGKVNGVRVLTGNNADEGPGFVEPNITTAALFNTWLKGEYPDLTAAEINQINTVYYPLKNEGTVPFATSGNSGADAVNVGSFAVGHQQRAVDFYSEATFVCPSYWLASAYQGSGKAGYKYQYSVPAAQHAADIGPTGFGYSQTATPNISPDFALALTTSWADFVLSGNPSISNLLANGQSTGNTAANPASKYPVWSTGSTATGYQMLNFNETGGTEYSVTVIGGYPAVEQYQGALKNAITKVNAYSWEAGRGKRCDYLRSIGASIPV